MDQSNFPTSKGSSGNHACLVLNSYDNVAVALCHLPVGKTITPGVCSRDSIPPGHKVALRPIATGEEIVKYGHVIGYSSQHIEAGRHVHTGNIGLRERCRTYDPCSATTATDFVPQSERRMFAGYPRSDGAVGTRNFIGIIATVSCSSDVAHFLADAASKRLLPDYAHLDGVVALGHGSGCCQAPGSEGLRILQQTIAGYARNPNFGGVLLVGLGCEVNLIENLFHATGLRQNDTLRAVAIQEAGGTEATIEQGLLLLRPMMAAADQAVRQTVPVAHLVVGLECGGSDAYSGVTANPALGAAVDLLVRNGGTAILSETPEIYGAEHLLIERSRTPQIAAGLVERIEWWEHYTGRHGAQINNNPTPGNKAGGISTILEKSLGAISKAGTTNLQGVFGYAEPITAKGLVFMDTPGYDVVSITGMIAGGANLICFTTGRGTVCGFRPVPTLKLASNSEMYSRLRNDMDLNCGEILDGTKDIAQMGADIFEEVIAAASGKKTKSERLGFGGSEFVPWHIGAVL